MSGFRLYLSAIFSFIFLELFCSQLLANDKDNTVEMLVPKVQLSYRPDTSTDEGGLWMAVEKLENDIQHSPLLIKNEIINDYVKGIVCRLAGEYCPDIRVYIIRNPNFNASMYPNGMMHVWTGLLLRTENEAQLAAVLGHEIAHYLRNHSIEQWRSIRKTTSAASFISLGLAVAGAGGVGDLVLMGGIMAGISSFSREHEREADIYGMKLMVETGYPPKESAELWKKITRESDNAKHKNSFNFFTASHPTSENRVKNLLKEADSRYPNSEHLPAYEERYAQTITPVIRTVLQDELKMHHFGRTEVILEYVSDSSFPRAELFYFKGEFHRLRKEEGDIEKAMAAYEQATKESDTPAEAYRELGYINYKRRDIKKAKEYFTEYLVFRPEATDRQMIEFYLKAE